MVTKIEVTQTDIDKAIEIVEGDFEFDTPHICPVAQALGRILPGLQFKVLDEHIEAVNGMKIKLPAPAIEFVNRFDNNYDSVRPIAFEIDL